jgi:hypothetical protein
MQHRSTVVCRGSSVVASCWIERCPRKGKKRGTLYRVRFRLGGRKSVPQWGGSFPTLRTAEIPLLLLDGTGVCSTQYSSSCLLRIVSPTFRFRSDRSRVADGDLESMQNGGDRPFSPHGLRHRRATLWHLAGVPAAEAAAWLGHSPEEHLKTYAHAVIQDRREVDYERLRLRRDGRDLVDVALALEAEPDLLSRQLAL